MKDKVFHVISNTHWDREWRYPFERNRQMLVEMIDATLDILLSVPEYRAFHLDSQSIVLNDYLAVRPEKRDVIRKLVQGRRLLIGPWFILPDEFFVGGENLIRNLLLGHRVCAEYGSPMKVGYSPFSWGQISQLPQIYRGFGIDVVMFYRGVNALESPRAEFLWEGADGTRVVTSRFSTMPRYNFYFYIYRPVVHNESVSDIEYRWKRGGIPFHFADSALREEDYFLLDPVDEYYSENIVPSVKAIIEKQAGDFTTPHVFWAEGHDSSGPNRETVRILGDIRELMPDIQVLHSTLEEYALALKRDVDTASLPIVKGERRSSQYDARSTNLYGYTTSARMYLKQKNFEAEKWLQFYAEPFNSIAGLHGLDARDQYLSLAWYPVLENSAHDSIGGCSLDEVHDDMMARYKKSIEISKGIFARAAKHIAKSIDLSTHPAGDIHLVAFNPTTCDRVGVVEAFIDIPTELDKGAIDVVSQDGRKCTIQSIDTRPSEPVLEQMTDRPMFLKVQRYHCFVETPLVPSLGYSTMHVSPKKRGSTRRQAKKIGTTRGGLPLLENEYLRVSVQRNGTLIVLDKTARHGFRNLGYFYDEGEAGHAWVHKPVPPYVTTLRSRPVVSFLHNGPLRATVSVKHSFSVPVSLGARNRKPVKMIALPLEVRITLDKGSRRVDFEVEVENHAESHRLRMMFPTGIEAPYSYGEGQFDVVARPAIRPDTRTWVEQPMYDYPLHHFVDVHDGRLGAAIFVAGLKEYEFLDDRGKTVALTLLRGFKYVIQPSSVQDYSHQKGSQCLGRQRYRLAFCPHRGSWEDAGIYAEALHFNNDIRLCQFASTRGTLPAVHSFLRVEPANLIFSCLKETEDRTTRAYVLRVYNPTGAEIRGSVEVSVPIRSASFQTLEEKYVADIQLASERRVELSVAPKKIITIRLDFQPSIP